MKPGLPVGHFSAGIRFDGHGDKEIEGARPGNPAGAESDASNASPGPDIVQPAGAFQGPGSTFPGFRQTGYTRAIVV